MTVQRRRTRWEQLMKSLYLDNLKLSQCSNSFDESTSLDEFFIARYTYNWEDIHIITDFSSSVVYANICL